jgi:hypothetical protein
LTVNNLQLLHSFFLNAFIDDEFCDNVTINKKNW